MDNATDGGTFLGRPYSYWIELGKQAEDMNVVRLISEMATLRAKVNYYESRIDELSKFMAIKLEVKNG
jgi:hypothetical protein